MSGEFNSEEFDEARNFKDALLKELISGLNDFNRVFTSYQYL